MGNKRVGVLLGGISSERQVSLATGNAVYEALEACGYDVVKVFVDRNLDTTLREARIDAAFIGLHGRFGEDGCVQGMLEMMGIPYTGSGVLSSSLAMNKVKSKELFRLHNLPTPPYYVLKLDDLDDIEEVHGSFGFPVVVKPVTEGSSVGVTIVRDLEGLEAAAEAALRFDRQVLVERYAKGMEVSVAILDGRVLGSVEIEPRAEFYDYGSKYDDNGSRYHMPARLNPTRHQNVVNLARRAAQSLGCSGVCRVDLIVTEGDNEYVLEVNTLPGMTPTSLVPKLASTVGMEFPELCREVIEGARLHVGVGALEGERRRRRSPRWEHPDALRPRLDA